MQDTAGPIARTVTDAAILLDALVGYDSKDKYTAAVAIAAHKTSYAESLDPEGLKGARIGVLKEAFGDDLDPDCARVNRVVGAAIGAMRTAGALTIEISLPNVKEFIAETSLYTTHSRHDINEFLKASAATGLPFH